MMDSHTDRQYVLVVDRVGVPKDEVFVHSRELTWIVRSAGTCWYREPLLDVVVRRIVIEVVKPMWLWEFTVNC